ncbi:MAG TPA: hypothetical protein VGM26_14715 [Rhizomicrobium sp.]|jgi:hypothetical protein
MKAEILPPLSATVHVKPAGWRFGLRLWLPLFPFWLLLLPVFLLALPFLFAASVIFGFRLLKTLGAVLGVLAGFRETRVEVENRNTRIFVKLN